MDVQGTPRNHGMGNQYDSRAYENVNEKKSNRNERLKKLVGEMKNSLERKDDRHHFPQVQTVL